MPFIKVNSGPEPTGASKTTLVGAEDAIPQRKILSQAEKDEYERVALAALAGEAEYEASLHGAINGGNCEMCNSAPQTKRTLCDSCYKEAARFGDVDYYPTRAYLDNPEAHMNWMLRLHPELLENLVADYGYEINRIPGWKSNSFGKPSAG